MCRVVPRLGVPRPKNRAMPRLQQARADDRHLRPALGGRRLTCVDESGINLALTRWDGRAPRGERVLGSVPQNYGPHVTRLGTLGAHGLQAVMTVEGAPDAEVFRTDITRVRGPTLRPGDSVVMDNLRAHKAVGVPQALARRGARRLYLPPYAPDLSPIEPCGSKLKTALRQAKARTRDALNTAMPPAIKTVTRTHTHHWFAHGGYALQ